jgi:hypothetical protein
MLIANYLRSGKVTGKNRRSPSAGTHFDKASSLGLTFLPLSGCFEELLVGACVCYKANYKGVTAHLKKIS